MENQYKYKNSMLFLFLLLIASLLMGIGYAAINTIVMNVEGTATAAPNAALYISNVTFVSDANGENNSCTNTYENLALTSTITLDSANTNSYVEYEIEIVNGTADTYTFKNPITNSTFYSNDDIKYELIGLAQGDEIATQSIKTFIIRFKYDDALVAITNNTLNSTINFDFAQAFSVTYKNVTGNFPSKAYQNENLVVNIGTGYSYMNITINDTLYEEYKYQSGVLTIPGTDINGNIEIEPITQISGAITASLSPTAIDLTTNDSTAVSLQINNTYNGGINIAFTSSNNAFDVLDSNNNQLNSYKIDNNSNEILNITVRRKNTEYDNGTENLKLTFSCNNGQTIDTNTITISVPTSDKKPPVINATTLSLTASNGDLTASWSGSDETAGTIKYTIVLYNDAGVVETANESSTSTGTITHNFTGKLTEGLTNHTYYVKVYGEDIIGNSGISYLDTATTSTEYCKKSENLVIYSIKGTYTDIKSSNTDKFIESGAKFETTLSYSGGNALGGNVTNNTVNVTMGGTNVITGGRSVNNIATYTNSQITISSVTGNIEISGSGAGTCLIEGTEITMADGTKKKIEDVGYDDLLLVWNYETGKFTKEYPIWIEKEHETQIYQLTTFSDGTVLKTFNFHGVFSLDQNMFVSVDDTENFNVGTTIAKINKTKDGFVPVKVEKIEYIEETVSYYHVVSTWYFNVIANDLLTTDGTTILTNLYGFKDNIMWANPVANEEQIYAYSELEDVIPYYLYKGGRALEGKYIEQYLPLEEFKIYLKCNQMNPNMLLEPMKDKTGKNVWMVTTDDDKVTEKNKSKYLVQEGTYYTLPEPKNRKGFKGWYNTAERKIYQPGETVQIWMGTHFSLIYEN